jgi:hypothetical protein
MRGFAFSIANLQRAVRHLLAPITPKFLPRFCHEGFVLLEVGEDPSPRLQGGSPSWQGLRDLQVQPAFQGASALSEAQVVRSKAAMCGLLRIWDT